MNSFVILFSLDLYEKRALAICCILNLTYHTDIMLVLNGQLLYDQCFLGARGSSVPLVVGLHLPYLLAHVFLFVPCSMVFA